MVGEEGWPERLGRFVVEAPVDAAERTAMFTVASDQGERGLLKVVRRPDAADPDKLRTRRFLEEVSRLRALDHPGLVKVLDAGVERDCYFLVVDPVDGRTLEQVMRTELVDFGALLAVALEVGDTLAQLHRVDVTVRDLEPTNVVIDRFGRAVIAGVALSALTRLGANEVLGAPGFVAPELLLGLNPSPLSDQYAFGRLLLYLAGVGRRTPIDRSQPIRPQVEASFHISWETYPSSAGHQDLRPILERLTMHRAAERYPAVQEAVDELVKLALHSAPELEGGEVTEPVDMEATIPEPMLQRGPRTRSIVVANDGVLSIEVEDVDAVSGPVDLDGPADYLDQLRQTAERHLTEHGGAHLLSPAGLPTSGPAQEPTTVPSRVRAPEAAPRDYDEMAETLVPDPVESTKTETDRSAYRPAPTPGPQGRVAFTVTRDTLRPPAAARADTRAERPASGPSAPRLQEVRRRFNWPVFVTSLVVSFGLIWIASTVIRSVAGANLQPGVLPIAVSVPARASYGRKTPPTKDDERRARGHLSRARASFEKNRIEDAEAELVRCVEAADLPECHRTLAALLSLVQDPAAGAHLKRYLDSPGADRSLEKRLLRPGS